MSCQRAMSHALQRKKMEPCLLSNIDDKFNLGFL